MFLLLKYVGNLSFDICYIRACLKNHSRNLHALAAVTDNSAADEKSNKSLRQLLHLWCARRDEHEKRK